MNSVPTDSGEECKQAGATDCVEIVNFLFGDEEFRYSTQFACIG